jgi:hypothetical protein
MRRLYLLPLFFLFGFFSAQAQDFSLSDSNGPLSHDTIVEAFGAPDDAYIKKHIFITNQSTDDLDILVKKEELEILEGSDNTFCFNEACYPPFIYVAPTPMTIQPGETTGEQGFYGDYYPNGYQGISQIRYTFFDADDHTDSLSVIVKYVSGFVGTGSLDAMANQLISKPYPNPASSIAFFDIELKNYSAPTILVVYNLLGSEIRRFTFNEKSGRISIPVDDLEEGFYFYTFFIEEKHAHQSGRLIIKR